MKILKLKLFQEDVCYRKPFSLKVSETYPLPPYSTVIGMLHNILDAETGEHYRFNISIQGDYESVYNNYTHMRKFLNDIEKEKYKKIHNKEIDAITKPLNVMHLHNVNLIIHIKGEDSILDKIYSNITENGKAIILGQGHNIARLDNIGFVTCKEILQETVLNHNAYISNSQLASDRGTYFRLNTYYTIKNDARLFEKVDVKYVEAGTRVTNCEIDDENDLVFFVLN